MSGWLFVIAVTLLMAAVIYFAWQSDTAAIAEQREAAAEGEGEREPGPESDVSGPEPTR